METSSPGPSRILSLTEQVEHIKELISLSYSAANEGFSHQIFRRSRGLTTGQSQILRELDSLKRNYQRQQTRRDSSAEDSDDLASDGGDSGERGHWSDDDNFQKELKDIRRRNEEALEFAEGRIDYLDDERGELSKSVQDLRARLEQADDRQKELTETTDQTRSELQQARNEKIEVSDTLEKTRQKLETLDGLLAEATARNKSFQSLSERNQHLENTIEEFRESLSSKDQETEAARDALRNASINHERRVKELRESLEEATRRTQALDKLTSAHEELEKRTEDLDAQLNERNEQLKNEQDTLRRVKAERDEKNDKIEKMMALADSKEQDLKALGERNQEVQQDLRRLEASLSLRDEDIRTAKEEIQKLKAEQEFSQESHERSLNDANELARGSRQDAQEAQKALEAVRKELDDSQTTHAQVEKENAKSVEEFRRAQTEYNKQKDGLEGNLRELESQLVKKEHEIRIARDALEGVQATYIKQSHNLENALKEVRASLAAKEQEGSQSRVALQAARDELKVLQKALEAAKAEHSQVLNTQTASVERWKRDFDEAHHVHERELIQLRETHEKGSRSLQDEIRQESSRLEELQKEFAESIEQHGRIEAQLKDQLSELSQTHKNEKQNLQQLLDKECSKSTELERVFLETRKEHENANNQIEGLQDVIRASESDVQNLRHRLENEQSNFAELEHAHEKSRDERDGFKAQFDDLQRSSDQFRQLHDDQFGQALKDLAAERSKLAKVEAINHNKSEELQRAQERLQNIECSANDDRKKLEQQIRNLESDLENNNSKMFSLEQKHEQALQDVAAERSKLAKTEETHRTQSDQLQAAQYQLRDVEEANSQLCYELKERIQQLERETEGSHSKMTEVTEAHQRAMDDLLKERSRALDAEQAHQNTAKQLQEMQDRYKDLEYSTTQLHESLEHRVEQLENEAEDSRLKFTEAENGHRQSRSEAEQLHKQQLDSADQELANAMSKLVGLEAAMEESKHSADIKLQENMNRLKEEASKFSEAEQLHSKRVRALEHERDESIRQITDLESSHTDVRQTLDNRILQFERDLEKEKTRFHNAEQAHIWQVASTQQAHRDAQDRAEGLQKMIDELHQSRREEAERIKHAADEERSRAVRVEQSLRQRLKELEQAHTASLENAHGDVVSLQKQLAEAKNSHWKKVQEIQQTHDTETDELRTSLRDGQRRLRDLEASHRSALGDLEDHLAFKLADAESTKRREIQELEAKLQQQAKDMEQLLEQAKLRHAEERIEAEKIWKGNAEKAKDMGKREVEEIRADFIRQTREAERSHRSATKDLEEQLARGRSEAESRRRKELEQAGLKHDTTMKATIEAHETKLKNERDLHGRLIIEAEKAQKLALGDLQNRLTTRIKELEANLGDAEARHGTAFQNVQEKHAQQSREVDERHQSAITDLEMKLAKELARSDAAHKQILASQAEEHARMMTELRESYQAQLHEAEEAHERTIREKQEAVDRDLTTSEEHHRQVLEEVLSNERQVSESKLTEIQASHRAALAENMAEAQSKSESEASARAKQHELEVGHLRESHTTEVTALRDKLQETLETNERISDEKASLLSEMKSLRQQLENSRLDSERDRAVDRSAREEVDLLKQRLEEASMHHKNITMRMGEEVHTIITSAQSIKDERDTLATQIATLRLNREAGMSGDKSTEDSLRKRLLSAKKRESRFFKEQDFLTTQVRALQQQLQHAQDEVVDLRGSFPTNGDVHSVAQPRSGTTRVVSKVSEVNSDLSYENEELRRQLSALRLEVVRARAAATAQQKQTQSGRPSTSRRVTLHALESGSRPERPVKQKVKPSMNSNTSPQSFEEYLERAEAELSDLGKAISANETLFAQKIHEHVSDLQKAKDQLSQEYKVKHEAMLQERAELEQKLATKQAEDLTEARTQLIAQYTSHIGTPKRDENLAKSDKLTPQSKQALKEADAQLVAEHDQKLAKKKSQIEIKHERDVQALGEQFDEKFSQLLKDWVNLEADLSISPGQFEQISKTLELEVERMSIGSRDREKNAVPRSRTGMAEPIHLMPAQIRSPGYPENGSSNRLSEPLAIRSRSESNRPLLLAEDPQENYRMVEESEISRSFLDSPSPSRTRIGDVRTEKINATRTKSLNVLPIPHRIAAAKAAEASSPRSQAESPSLSPQAGPSNGFVRRRVITSPEWSNRPVTPSAAIETAFLGFDGDQTEIERSNRVDRSLAGRIDVNGSGRRQEETAQERPADRSSLRSLRHASGRVHRAV